MDLRTYILPPGRATSFLKLTLFPGYFPTVGFRLSLMKNSPLKLLLYSLDNIYSKSADIL